MIRSAQEMNKRLEELGFQTRVETDQHITDVVYMLVLDIGMRLRTMEEELEQLRREVQR